MNRYRIGIVVIPLMLGLLLPGCARTGGGRVALLPRVLKGKSDSLAAGRAHEKAGNFEKARDAYLEVVRSEPDNWEGHHRLGIALSRMGRYDLARPCLKKARELAPDRAEVLADLGHAQLQLNDLTMAEQTLRDALAKDPKNVAATKNLAEVVGRQGRMEECFSLYRTVGSEAEAHASVAYLLTQQDQAGAVVRTAAAEPTARPAAVTARSSAANVPDSLQSAADSLAALQAARKQEIRPVDPAFGVATADVTTPDAGAVFGDVRQVRGEEPSNPFETRVATDDRSSSPAAGEEPNPFAVREQMPQESGSRFAWAEPETPAEPAARERPAWWEATETNESPAAIAGHPLADHAAVPENENSAAASIEEEVAAELEEPAGYVTFNAEPEPQVEEHSASEEPEYDPSLMGPARRWSTPARHPGWDAVHRRGMANEWLPAPPRSQATPPSDLPRDLPPGADAPPRRTW